jgi:predicted FMN-binding regulatory protein PaiB
MTGAAASEPQALIPLRSHVPLVFDDTSGEAMLILHMTKANAKK